MLKAIEKDPKARYRSAEAMGEDLRRFLADEPIRARQVSACGAILAMGAAQPGDRGAGRRARRSAGARHGRFAAGDGAVPHPGRGPAHARRSSRGRAARSGPRTRRRQAAANASLRTTQEELHRTVYATRSNLALAAWDAADVGRLRSLLDLLRPARGRARPPRLGVALSLAARSRGSAHAPGSARTVSSTWRSVPTGKPSPASRAEAASSSGTGQPGESRLTTGVTTKGRHADLASGVSALAFSPDGRSLAGPGPEESLMLYAVDTGLPTLSFEGSPGAVLGLALSPDGRTLVAALSAHVNAGLGRPRRPSDPQESSADTTARSPPSRSAPTAAPSPRPAMTARSSSGTPRTHSQPLRRPQGAHRRGPRRGLQPRRPADRLRRPRPDPPGLGCPIRGGARRDPGPHRCGDVAGLPTRQREGRDGLRRRDGARLGHRLGPGASHLQGARRRGQLPWP